MGLEDNIQCKIDNIEKMNKKFMMSLEVIRDSIELKDTNEKKIKEVNEINLKIIEKLIYILDQVDNINKFAVEIKNEALINNIDSVQRNIKKELRDISVEEIPTANELFDNNIHKCVQVIETSGKDKFQIVGTIRKGYQYRGKVIRPAEVIATK
jgi:molecular chaperone GrpE